IEWTELDWKAATEPEKKRRENRPKIELDQIQPERRDEVEIFSIFPNRSRIRNRCEDKANYSRTCEKQCRTAPFCFEVIHQRLGEIISNEDTPAFDRRLSCRSNKSAGTALPEECREWRRKRRELTESRCGRET